MKRNYWTLAATLLVGALGTACGNPTVDPDATFTAKGELVDAEGAALANAEIRLIKYWSTTNLLAPSTETFFADDPRGDADLGFGIAVVATARTNAQGQYEIQVKGRDIQKPDGFTSAEGLVEVADTVIVARDPADDTQRSGVFTYSFLYQQAAKVWDAGRLNLWSSGAEANLSNTLTSGQILFSWKKIDRGQSMVKNQYRVTIEGKSGTTARLVIRCNEGQVVEGGCAPDPTDATRLVRSVSAYSVAAWYSDSGDFVAYIEGNSPDYRYVSRFVVPMTIPTIPRDPIGLVGVWASSDLSDQNLLDTLATDGKAATREPITNNAHTVYVKLALSEITDAGILNSLVTNAANGCLVLEFSVTNHTDIAAAKASTSGWEQKGKFCGENGARDEVSALASFDTTASSGVVAAWMRVRAVADSAGMAAPIYSSIGEVALFKQRL